ncbi:hypothetical protein Asppvi_003814 [Aspergillus pseudoviridinutans]|uniref:Uncharacterized protein n=1 Tax=Aspergillus pseudoviridinutans TaxID=1517512 RepID=A0A9P3BBJ5_9EURO|nr:uncharacterized protein Asppvi_003814 [Aspergillus pseudoviridinutans]GIJ84959.1 hypothetical protein Asppvi_003814 [Aspergillus pseudoviridinutans]
MVTLAAKKAASSPHGKTRPRQPEVARLHFSLMIHQASTKLRTLSRRRSSKQVARISIPLTEKGDRSNRGTDHGHTGPTEGNPGTEQVWPDASAAKTTQRLIIAASARDSYLKQVWDHVRKLNQWAAEAREIINGRNSPSPGQCGSVDV